MGSIHLEIDAESHRGATDDRKPPPFNGTRTLISSITLTDGAYLKPVEILYVLSLFLFRNIAQGHLAEVLPNHGSILNHLIHSSPRPRKELYRFVRVDIDRSQHVQSKRPFNFKATSRSS